MTIVVVFTKFGITVENFTRLLVPSSYILSCNVGKMLRVVNVFHEKFLGGVNTNRPVALHFVKLRALQNPYGYNLWIVSHNLPSNTRATRHHPQTGRRFHDEFTILLPKVARVLVRP